MQKEKYYTLNHILTHYFILFHNSISIIVLKFILLINLTYKIITIQNAINIALLIPKFYFLKYIISIYKSINLIKTLIYKLSIYMCIQYLKHLRLFIIKLPSNLALYKIFLKKFSLSKKLLLSHTLFLYKKDIFWRKNTQICILIFFFFAVICIYLKKNWESPHIDTLIIFVNILISTKKQFLDLYIFLNALLFEFFYYVFYLFSSIPYEKLFLTSSEFLKTSFEGAYNIRRYLGTMLNIQFFALKYSLFFSAFDQFLNWLLFYSYYFFVTKSFFWFIFCEEILSFSNFLFIEPTFSYFFFEHQLIKNNDFMSFYAVDWRSTVQGDWLVSLSTIFLTFLSLGGVVLTQLQGLLYVLNLTAIDVGATMEFVFLLGKIFEGIVIFWKTLCYLTLHLFNIAVSFYNGAFYFDLLWGSQIWLKMFGYSLVALVVGYIEIICSAGLQIVMVSLELQETWTFAVIFSGNFFRETFTSVSYIFLVGSHVVWASAVTLYFLGVSVFAALFSIAWLTLESIFSFFLDFFVTLVSWNFIKNLITLINTFCVDHFLILLDYFDLPPSNLFIGDSALLLEHFHLLILISQSTWFTNYFIHFYIYIFFSLLLSLFISKLKLILPAPNKYLPGTAASCLPVRRCNIAVLNDAYKFFFLDKYLAASRMSDRIRGGEIFEIPAMRRKNFYALARQSSFASPAPWWNNLINLLNRMLQSLRALQLYILLCFQKKNRRGLNTAPSNVTEMRLIFLKNCEPSLFFNTLLPSSLVMMRELRELFLCHLSSCYSRVTPLLLVEPLPEIARNQNQPYDLDLITIFALLGSAVSLILTTYENAYWLNEKSTFFLRKNFFKYYTLDTTLLNFTKYPIRHLRLAANNNSRFLEEFSGSSLQLTAPIYKSRTTIHKYFFIKKKMAKPVQAPKFPAKNSMMRYFQRLRRLKWKRLSRDGAVFSDQLYYFLKFRTFWLFAYLNSLDYDYEYYRSLPIMPYVFPKFLWRFISGLEGWSTFVVLFEVLRAFVDTARGVWFDFILELDNAPQISKLPAFYADFEFLNCLVKGTNLPSIPKHARRLTYGHWMSSQFLSLRWYYRDYMRPYIWLKRGLRPLREVLYFYNPYRIFEEISDFPPAYNLFTDTNTYRLGATPDEFHYRSYYAPKLLFRFKWSPQHYLYDKNTHFNSSLVTSLFLGYNFLENPTFRRQQNFFFSSLQSWGRSNFELQGIGKWAPTNNAYDLFVRVFFYKYWANRQAYSQKFLAFNKFQFFKKFRLGRYSTTKWAAAKHAKQALKFNVYRGDRWNSRLAFFFQTFNLDEYSLFYNPRQKIRHGIPSFSIFLNNLASTKFWEWGDIASEYTTNIFLQNLLQFTDYCTSLLFHNFWRLMQHMSLFLYPTQIFIPLNLQLKTSHVFTHTSFPRILFNPLLFNTNYFMFFWNFPTQPELLRLHTKFVYMLDIS